MVLYNNFTGSRHNRHYSISERGGMSEELTIKGLRKEKDFLLCSHDLAISNIFLLLSFTFETRRRLERQAAQQYKNT